MAVRRWIFACAALSAPVLAGAPRIEAVSATALGEGRWRIDVTVAHADSGWEHYANGWRVVDEAGRELGFRVLHHPHVNEQPFTRSLRLALPPTVATIRAQAVDSVHGDGALSAPISLAPAAD